MKKLISFILVLTIILSISVTSFAEYENTHINTDEHLEDFVAVALTQVGYSADTISKYSQNENWNTDFVVWCAKEANIPETAIPYVSSVQEMHDFFKNCNQLVLKDEHTPKKGDIVFLQYENELTDCAIVIAADDDNVTAILGNDNGSVNKKIYSSDIEKIYAYASPDFSFTSKYVAGTYIITASALNFREGPDTSYSIITSIPNGTVVEITSFKGDWGYITYNNKSGWINMDYAVVYNDTHHNTNEYSVNWKVIDVSKWQGKIDWEKVAQAGFKAVIIRIGLRGSVSREILIDDKFLEYYEGAKEQGLHIGCYFYSAAKSEADAIAEAEFVIDTIDKYEIELDMPAYLDMEDKVVEKCGKTAIFNMTKAYLDTMDAANIYSGVYCSAYWAKDYYNQSLFNSHALWVADWDGACDYTGEYGMWQYSEKGRITGIETKYTDLNTCYINYPQLISDNKYNEKVELKLSLADINGDGSISPTDARLALRAAASLVTFSAEQTLAGDIDKNGILTASDARIILRIAVNLEKLEDYTDGFNEIESEVESEIESEIESETA